MNNISINDSTFQNTDAYKNFINENPNKGNLNIRAYAASEALPIPNVNIIVSKIIDNYKVIFFEGNTNNSGVIEAIELPTHATNQNDLVAPTPTKYDIEAIYDSVDLLYHVNMYSGIKVNQNIVLVPEMDGR